MAPKAGGLTPLIPGGSVARRGLTPRRDPATNSTQGAQGGGPDPFSHTVDATLEQEGFRPPAFGRLILESRSGLRRGVRPPAPGLREGFRAPAFGRLTLELRGGLRRGVRPRAWGMYTPVYSLRLIQGMTGRKMLRFPID